MRQKAKGALQLQLSGACGYASSKYLRIYVYGFARITTIVPLLHKIFLIWLGGKYCSSYGSARHCRCTQVLTFRVQDLAFAVPDGDQGTG